MENVVRINAPEASQWQAVTASFLLFKRVSGMSQRTMRDYETYLYAFFRQYPNALDPRESRSSVLSYLSGVMAPATYNLRRAYLRSFWSWLVSEGISTRNPVANLPSRKAEPRIVKTDIEDIRKVLDSFPGDTWNGLRDFALLMLQVDTGIRPGEALSLLASDMSIQGRTVNVRAAITKTRTARVLPISDATAAAIDKLMRIRSEEWKASPLFCTSSGTPLPVRGWYHRLEIACKKAGVPKISPYDCRHSFALLYLKRIQPEGHHGTFDHDHDIEIRCFLRRGYPRGSRTILADEHVAWLTTITLPLERQLHFPVGRSGKKRRE